MWAASTAPGAEVAPISAASAHPAARRWTPLIRPSPPHCPRIRARAKAPQVNAPAAWPRAPREVPPVARDAITPISRGRATNSSPYRCVRALRGTVVSNADAIAGRGQAAGSAEARRHHGTGPDHRRLGRRPQRHRHLFAGRRAIRLRARLDAAADLSADVRDPDDQRPYRPGDGTRPRRQHAAALSGGAALWARRPAAGRQHDQHRRRSRRHGGGAAPAGRRRRRWSASSASRWSRCCSKCSCAIRATPRCCAG